MMEEINNQPRKRAHLLVFKVGGGWWWRRTTTNIKNERVCSFSRLVVREETNNQPRKRACLLVFKVGGGWWWRRTTTNIENCKGNPLRFRRPPVFRFRFRSRPPSVLRFHSRHLVSLPQRLWSNDILRHPLPTRFCSRSHDVA